MGTERGNHLDETDDMAVEFLELLSRNPQFLVRGTSHCLHAIASNELGVNVEARNKAGTARFDVPVSGNLSCVFFVEHGVEDWLIRQSRRELAPPRCLDKLQLLWSHRSIESHGLHAV